MPRPVGSRLQDRDTTPWPMGDVLPQEPLPPEIDEKKLEAALDLAFAAPSRVSALVVVYKDRLVAEQYAPGIIKDTRLENWSIGKSLTATLIGRLIQEGHFELDDPVPRVASGGRSAACDPHLRLVTDVERPAILVFYLSPSLHGHRPRP